MGGAALNAIFRPAAKTILRGVFPFRIESLFAGSASCAWFAPDDLQTLFQDADGQTLVTSDSQTVAVALDKSRGLQIGPELAPGGGTFDSATGWATEAGWTISGGLATSTGGAGRLYTGLILSLEKTYSVTVNVASFSNPGLAYIGTNAANGLQISGAGEFTAKLRALGTTRFYIGGGFAGSIDSVSVKEIYGNHTYQATLANRPAWRSDNSLENVSSDTLNWFAPAGVYTVAYIGGSGPVILDAQSLSGATNIMISSKMYEYIAIPRALGFSEKSNLLQYLNKRSDTL